MKNILQICMSFFMCLVFASPCLALTYEEFEDKPTKNRHIDVPEETIEHWELATHYKSKRRYELARQHYLLALATCNSTELRDSLKRELQMVDLQIRTLR